MNAYCSDIKVVTRRVDICLKESDGTDKVLAKLDFLKVDGSTIAYDPLTGELTFYTTGKYRGSQYGKEKGTVSLTNPDQGREICDQLIWWYAQFHKENDDWLSKIPTQFVTTTLYV